MTFDEARVILLTNVGAKKSVAETAIMVKKKWNSKLKTKLEKKAKGYFRRAIQRCAADHVAKQLFLLSHYLNDEMKGRIVGREGRNIRAPRSSNLSVDLIIDEYTQSCYSYQALVNSS